MVVVVSVVVDPFSVFVVVVSVFVWPSSVVVVVSVLDEKEHPAVPSPRMATRPAATTSFLLGIRMIGPLYRKCERAYILS